VACMTQLVGHRLKSASEPTLRTCVDLDETRMQFSQDEQEIGLRRSLHCAACLLISNLLQLQATAGLQSNCPTHCATVYSAPSIGCPDSRQKLHVSEQKE
jgi:hypothetical protein